MSLAENPTSEDVESLRKLDDLTRAMAQTRHELRTPLNHIIGYSELLLDEAEEKGLGALQTDLSKIRDSGRRLLKMLNALLTPDAMAARLGVPVEEMAVETARQMVRSSEALPGEEGVRDLAFASILAPLPDITPAVPTENPILVVDDDASNREVLGRLLSQMGYSVAGAPNGKVALDILGAYPCDAVLLDVMMPVMDGYQALVAIRENPALRHVPVMMISALDEVQVVVRCIEAGAEDYLPKPFNPTMLKARLTAALEKKRLRDQERALFGELAVAHEKLQNAARLRDDMTRLLIQDLRVPLTALLTSLELSATMEADADEAERQEFLRLALQGGNKTLTMMDGLLDIARAEDGLLPLLRGLFPPIDIAESAARQVAELALAKELECIVRADSSELPPLSVDGGRVRQALVNLLENAIKFTPEGRTITLLLSRSTLADDRPGVAFHVWGAGPVIPSDRVENVLDRFEQAEARLEGLRVSPGLALTFCKYVAIAHGGELHMDGADDRQRGTDFALVLPVAA